MRVALALAVLLVTAAAAFPRPTPYVGFITWNDGRTAIIHTRQHPGDFHGPPLTSGRFRCTGACPTRRGTAALVVVFVGWPFLDFNGARGKAAGPRCEMRYTAETRDAATGCVRDDRTLHCGPAGVDGPSEGVVITTPTRCRALMVGR